MRIERIIIYGFGSFDRRYELAFDQKGPTVILGKNEAGKSTLLAAITATLFGFRDHAQRKRYEPWGPHEAYAAEVWLRREDQVLVRIKRSFKNEQVTVTEERQDGEILCFDEVADPRSREASTANYFDLLAEAIGLKDEGVFRQTVYFEQQSLETAISDQIRRMLSGSATMDYRAVQHELHRRYAELTNENPWRARRGGRQSDAPHSFEDQEQRLSRAREALAKTLALEAEVKERTAEQAALDAEHARLDRELDAHERLLPLLERRASIRRRLTEVSEARDRREAQSQRVREIETYARQRYGHLARAPSQLSELVKGWRDATQESHRLEEALARKERARADWKPEWNQPAGLGLAAAGIGLAILIFGLSAGPLRIAAAALALPLGAAGFAFGRRLGGQVFAGREALDRELMSLRADLQSANKRAQDLFTRCGSAVVGRAPEEVLSDHTAFLALREERRTLTASLQALGDKAVLDQRFDEILRERAKVDTDLEELRRRAPELPGDDALRELETKIHTLREVRERHALRASDAKRHLEDLKSELGQASASVEGNLAVLSDGVRNSRQRLGELDLERSALKLAIDTLDACVAEFQELDLERLEEETSRIFRQITGERYSSVQLEASLEPKVRLERNSPPVSPESLSQGARDQLYFALRVAMGSHLSEEVRLPLLLDDPFVNFDRERRDLARGILTALPEHQVVLMSCHEDYREFGGTVIDLDERSRAMPAPSTLPPSHGEASAP